MSATLFEKKLFLPTNKELNWYEILPEIVFPFNYFSIIGLSLC